MTPGPDCNCVSCQTYNILFCSEYDLSVSEIAILIKKSRMGVNDAMHELLDKKLVRKTRIVGGTQLYKVM